MKISQENREKLQGLVKSITNAWSKICERLMEFFRNNWKLLKKAAIKWYQLEEEKEVVVRQRYKRDFTRQKISHQVVDRKPKYMIRKIIR